MIVPTLCVGMPLVTLRVTLWGAERPGLHSHAERGNDHIWVFSGSELAAIDRPTQRHQPLHQFLRINRFRFVHYSFPRNTDPSTIAAARQTRESAGYLFG